MAHKLVVLEWLYKADEDFGFAQLALAEAKNYFNQICFHFQQAAEKYLKAYIVKFGLKFEKEHDLVKLLKICALHDSFLTTLEEDCRFLNPFYFEIRYPDQVFAVCTREQAEEAFRKAGKIRDLVKEKIGIKREVTLREIEKESKKVDKILRKGENIK